MSSIAIERPMSGMVDIEMQCTRFINLDDCQAGELNRLLALIPRGPYSDSLGWTIQTSISPQALRIPLSYLLGLESHRGQSPCHHIFFFSQGE